MDGLQPDHLARIFGVGLATVAGGLFLLVIQRPSDRLLDTLLGSGWIMLAATAFAARGVELAVLVAAAIGIQNLPEGFAAAAPLLTAGVRRRKAVGFAALTGVVEPPAAPAAIGAAGLTTAFLPFGLGFERGASYALLIGFALMLVLDTALG